MVVAIPLVLPNMFFDGTRFWHRHDETKWEWLNMDSATRLLRVKYGLVNLRPNSGASIIDTTLREVEDKHRIAAAAPFVHNKEEVIKYRGEKYLNVSTVECVKPAETGDPSKWPWLYEFYQKRWAEPADVQRDHFFAWFQRYYSSALAGTMLPGQNVIIAGPPDQGKTLESRKILGAAMGGTASAASFLKGRTTFNAECARFAFWTMDDEDGAFSWDDRVTFSNNLKAAAANQEVRCEPKFLNAFTIPWFGRVWLTCNFDVRSMKVLPDLRGSIKDKLMMFMCSELRPEFLERAANEARIERELPFFLRYILDWKPPSYVISDRQRYGVNSYAHQDIVDEAHASSSEVRLAEILNKVSAELDEGKWFTVTGLRAHINTAREYATELKEFSRDRLREGLCSPDAGRYVKATRKHGGVTEFFITGKNEDLPRGRGEQIS